MRKLLLMIGCIILYNSLFSQTKSGEYFLDRSKKQQKIAWILLGTGAAAITTGILIEAPERGTGNSQSFTGGLIVVGGILSSLTSVPFFISSAKNKRRAISLSIMNQRSRQFRGNTMVLRDLPSISLGISL